MQIGTPNGSDPSSKTTGMLIENNIWDGNRASVVLGYGAAGCVVGYNYFTNSTNDASAPQVAKHDILIHSSFPEFNLFEGNIGNRLFTADSFHGNSNCQTLLRNWCKGKEPGKNSALFAVELDIYQRYFNAVGNIVGYNGIVADVAALGSPGISSYEKIAPAGYSYGNHFIGWLIGYVGEGGQTDISDPQVLATLIRHGNYDSITNDIKWAPNISDRNIPNSLYLPGKPAWFGDLAWPPFDPAKAQKSMSDLHIPASYRYAKSSLPVRNISTRGFVQNGDRVLIGGFIVTGTGQKKVALRALGPSLPLSPVLSDPIIELRNAGGGLVAKNDDWRSSQQAAIIATGLAPANDKESTVIAMLTPGSYTAVMRGANNATGIGLVEIYDLDNPGSGTRLANVSTLGNVLSGDGVLIGGFVLGSGDWSTPIAARALGPSLAQFGVSGVLADPTLELRDANGALIASNDNWKDRGYDELQGVGLAPSDSRESAILMRLAPGSYTVIVAGRNGMNGVGLVEIFNLH